ncbi:MAG TPA: MarP family serine protease [Solirubrobacteraceae bacterium]|jgi:uncharacterized membrane protein required for colicin V production|nr:MarP family serine protease [Solirubrobacteraceae bacterium]
MTTLDWIIVALAVLLAYLGYGRGFIVGVLSLTGFVLGVLIGTRLGPKLLSEGSSSPYAPAFGLIGAVLAGAILSTGLGNLGYRLRQVLRVPGLGVLDGVLGGALSACVGLGLVWIAAAVALQAPGSTNLRHDIQRSVILEQLNHALPPSGAILNALARIDPLPSLAAPPTGLAPPSSAIAREPHVRRALASVVRVLGTACGLGVEGSGWIAGPGLVVTNAHVVAGEEDTTVQVGGQPPSLTAHAVAFNPGDDVAVLRVDGLSGGALRLAHDPPEGRLAAIVGYPHNGPLEVHPARVGAQRSVVSQDAYGRGPVTREVTPFRGRVQSGNSGGPLIDARGRVVDTVFAATVGGGPPAGYGVPNTIVARTLAQAGGSVGTGPCAH